MIAPHECAIYFRVTNNLKNKIVIESSHVHINKIIEHMALDLNLGLDHAINPTLKSNSALELVSSSIPRQPIL